MDFEYDSRKSELNLEKHGIDFEEAKILWRDFRGFEIPVAAKVEERYILIARHREQRSALTQNRAHR